MKIDQLGFWVVLRPLSDKLVEVMWAKNGPVASEVVEVVHDDRHEQVDNLHIISSTGEIDRVLKPGFH